MQINCKLTSAAIILDTRRKTKNGYPIKIRVQNKTAKYIHLNEYSEKKHFKDTVLPSHPDYRRLKAFLLKRESDLIREVDYCNEHRLNLSRSIEIIKNGLEENTDLKIFLLQQEIEKLRKQTGIGIIEFYEIYINELKDRNRNTRHYEICKKEFQNYLGGDMNLNNIDYEFLNGYKNYKLRTGCGEAGVFYYGSNLKALFNEAQRRESLGIKQGNPFKGVFRKPARTKEIIIPNKEQKQKLWDFEGRESYKRTIDLFKFQLLIGGHDFIDISQLKWSDIKGNRIRFKRYKNINITNTLIENLLVPEALEIIKRYGTKDDERIFGFIHDASQNFSSYNVDRRNALRHLSQVSGCKMGTKTARFMFNSYAYSIGVSEKIVTLLQGHKSEGETHTYTKRLDYDLQDREHLRVVELI